MLVLSNSTTSEQEEDFNRWYTDQHIHDLVKLPGVVAATRYRMMPGIEVVPDVDEPQQKYLAIYEIEAETEAELREFATMLQQALGDGRAGVHAALDMTTLGGGSRCLLASASNARCPRSGPVGGRAAVLSLGPKPARAARTRAALTAARPPRHAQPLRGSDCRDPPRRGRHQHGAAPRAVGAHHRPGRRDLARRMRPRHRVIAARPPLKSNVAGARSSPHLCQRHVRCHREHWRVPADHAPA